MPVGALNASQAVADKGANYPALPLPLLPFQFRGATRHESVLEVGIKSGGRQCYLSSLHGSEKPRSLALHVGGGVGVPVYVVWVGCGEMVGGDGARDKARRREGRDAASRAPTYRHN